MAQILGHLQLLTVGFLSLCKKIYHSPKNLVAKYDLSLSRGSKLKLERVFPKKRENEKRKRKESSCIPSFSFFLLQSNDRD